MAELLLGTSGWSYAEWKGSFYPEKIRPEEMLAFYASRFGAVEINNSFYRVPSESALGKWRDTVPAAFRFAFKAPQEITHRRRLVDAESPTKRFAEVLAAMQDRLGPVLFQLPPYQRADLARLEGFLDMARPLYSRIAFEFRHVSWLVQPVFDLLTRYDAALCLTESDTERQPLHPAAHFAYLRSRKTEYEDAELIAWKTELGRMVDRGLDVFCFFKHEGSGKGPEFVRRMLGDGRIARSGM